MVFNNLDNLKKLSVSFEDINGGLRLEIPKKEFSTTALYLRCNTLQFKDNPNSKSHFILNIIGSHYTRNIHDS